MLVLQASFFAGCLALALAAVPFALIIFGPRLRASVSPNHKDLHESANTETHCSPKRS